MRLIGLTQGQFAMVDDEDYERIACHKWFAQWDPKAKCFYAARNTVVGNKRGAVKMHREIMGIADPKVLVDHSSPRSTLDNQKRNLRAASKQQNSFNRKLDVRNTSGYKGVHWHKNHKRLEARIMLNGKRVVVGVFGKEDKELAAKAYDRAAIKHFGPFAQLNFPEAING